MGPAGTRWTDAPFASSHAVSETVLFARHEVGRPNTQPGEPGKESLMYVSGLAGFVEPTLGMASSAAFAWGMLGPAKAIRRCATGGGRESLGFRRVREAPERK